ncbi:MAG: PQQ-dependent sugar dehydrogenase [Chloroflexota bacterium]
MALVTVRRNTFFLMLLGVLLLLSGLPAYAASLPSGFAEALFATGLAAPTAMEFAPDGRLFVTQQGGALRVIQGGSLLPTPFITLTVNSTGERGLLGIAFDPNFASNNFLYLYYTTSTAPVHNRVSRFTANGNVVVAGSEVVILELENLTAATNHNGGAIHFGSDGKLYVGVGENATSSNSQTLSNRLGKMLRINSDGTIPSANPFFGTATGVNRSIWALGLRNPFTFAFQPGSGRMFINDVGQSAWEEINDGIAGSNYGWPTTEGETTNPSFRSPLFAYGHGTSSTTGCAIAGGAFYNPSSFQFPANYLGDYFFADLCSNWIRRYDVASDTAIDFASATTTAPVDVKVGTDGSLYYLARGSGSNTGVVYRVNYTISQGDTLALYNPNQGFASLIDTQIDLPPPSSYFTYTPNAPVIGSGWVMGDWDRDGLKTPGLFKNGGFYYTNGIGANTTWSSVWIGAFPQTYPVAGRFDPAINHDCFGVVQLDYPGDVGKPLHYTCELNSVLPPSGLKGQWLGVVLPGSEAYQFTAGDWNGDGLDSVAARRGVHVSWGNTAPAQGVGTFPLAQYVGVPRAGGSLVVSGDWDDNGVDSFGLYYPADGYFFRRDDLTWNSGIYFLQRVGLPVGGALPASWHSGEPSPSSVLVEGAAAVEPADGLAPESTDIVRQPEEPELTETLAPSETLTPEITETVEVTETPPESTATVEVTPAPTEIVVVTEVVTETATPFPTLPLEGPSEPTVTPTPFPTLPIAEPTATPTDVVPTLPATPEPLLLPVLATMDDGALDWQATTGWSVTAQAAFGGEGLGWQVIAANTVESLRWTRGLDLRTVLPGQIVEVSYQSLLSSEQSTALVQISQDRVNWTAVSVAASSKEWVTESIDLSAYVGQVVYVQFAWTGIAPTEVEQAVDYWLVDSVLAQVLTPTALPSATPELSPEPPSEPTVVVTEEPTFLPPATEIVVPPSEPVIEGTSEAG